MVGLVFSNPSFSQQSQPAIMQLTRPSTCTLQFSDMQVQSGGSQFPVSSAGSFSFPSEDIGLPIGNVSMTSSYCNGVCSSCSSTSCPDGPYGTNLNDCLSECSQQIFIIENTLIQNGDPIPIFCNPPPTHVAQKNIVKNKKM